MVFPVSPEGDTVFRRSKRAPTEGPGTKSQPEYCGTDNLLVLSLWKSAAPWNLRDGLLGLTSEWPEVGVEGANKPTASGTVSFCPLALTSEWAGAYCPLCRQCAHGIG